MFKVPTGTIMTQELLSKCIQKHKTEVANRFQKLINAYMNDYQILNDAKKPSWKPDNRITVNFAKYITDTMNGFFVGNPIKTMHEDETISQFLEFLDQYNDQDDNNAELSKICSIFGRGYEMYFVDEVGRIGITYLTPLESFMIYDNSILERPLYFVRYYVDSEGVECGSWSNNAIIQHFTSVEAVRTWSDEEKIHGFDGVPATEYAENAEKQGIFEAVLPMIDAYNKAISEKANDVDYFADAYLKILGAKIEDEDTEYIRDNRIISFEGEDTGKMIVEFLEKPSGDETQENLIDRLERLIFQISMVANISDENFGGSSGVSLKYKLQSMSNLAKTKERKFTSGMNRRYKLIFSNPLSGMPKEAWVGIQYKFTQNIPANQLEEATAAQKLVGSVSKETILKTLSVVDDVKKEMERINKERDPLDYETDYPTSRGSDINVLEE
jgi:phage portal protein, SPP1 family